MKIRNLLRIVVDDKSLMKNEDLENDVFEVLINCGKKCDNEIIEFILDVYRYDILNRSIINEVMNSKLSNTDKKKILIGLIINDNNVFNNNVEIIVKADKILKCDSTGELWNSLIKLQSKKDFVLLDISDTIGRAQNGNSDAQNALANYYADGFGVELNQEKAEEWYKKAIANGDKNAKGNLATLYQQQCRHEDYEKLFEELIAEGDITAMHNLGSIYLNREDKKQRGIELLEKASSSGNEFSNILLGKYYLYTVKDVDKATEYFKKTNTEHSSYLIHYYLGYNNMIPVDIKKATEISNDLLKKGNIEQKYNVNILNSLNGKDVLIVDSFKSAEEIKINENKYGAIAVNGELYSISDYKQIKEKINEFLKDIDENNGNNEFDVFMSIYMKIISEIDYDYSAASNSSDNISRIRKAYTHRNLIGALIDKECVCAGYANTLNELLRYRGIDSINIESDDGRHLFNQVKINDNWYYADVTFDAYNVKSGKELENCLLSKKDFSTCDSHVTTKSDIHKSENTYSQDDVNDFFKNYKKLYLINECSSNKMFNIESLIDVINKFKSGKILKKVKEFLDR